MNILENSTIRAPSGKDEICAKFIIDDIETPFIFHGVMGVDEQYTFSFYASSESNGSIIIGDSNFEISTEWTRHVMTFTADSEDLAIYFQTTGTYYLYNVQLEVGNKDSAWTPNPEDIEVQLVDHEARILANENSIKLSVSSQTFEAYKDSTDSRLFTAESSISLLQDEISLKVEQADIDDATSLLRSEIELTETSILSTVSSTYTTLTETGELTTRLESAEQKLTKDSLVTTIGSYYATMDDVNVGIEYTKTIATQTADSFSWLISGDTTTGFTLTTEGAELFTSELNIDALTTFMNSAQNGTSTVINGGAIKTGTITADKIDVDDLFAQNITASGTITGANLVGATGNFSGNIMAATLVVDNKISINTAYGTTGKLLSTGESMDFPNVLWVDFDQIFSDVKFMSGYVDFYGEVYVEKGISVGETIGAEGIIRSEEAVSAGGMASIEVDSEGGSLNVMSAFGNLWHIDSPLENLRFVSQTDGAVRMELGRYGGLMIYNGCLELFHSTPCIDFHFGYSSSDFTSRIIEYKAGFLRVDAALYTLDYSGTYRRPVTSANGEENQVVMLSTSTSTKLSITGSWGDASTYTAKTITVSSSDIRLKESVEPSTVDALSLINKIKIRQFNWKDSGEHQNIGFIADELENLDEKLAVGGGYTEDGFMNVKSVDDFYLLGYLTKGVQELDQKYDLKVSELESKNEQLTVRIECRQDEQQILIEQLMDENAKLKKRVAQLEEQQAA